MNFQSKPKWSPSVRNAKMHGAAPKIYHLLMKLSSKIKGSQFSVWFTRLVASICLHNLFNSQRFTFKPFLLYEKYFEENPSFSSLYDFGFKFDIHVAVTYL